MTYPIKSVARWESHTSLPHNPLIAGGFFRSGQIEAWGRGIEKISNARKLFGQSEPFYRTHSKDEMIGFNTDTGIVKNIADNIVENVGINPIQIKFSNLCNRRGRDILSFTNGMILLASKIRSKVVT
jgi:hypothetical protein